MDIKFIGWCYDKANNHDKVWGIGDIGNGQYLSFWGRRGYTLQTKPRYMSHYDAESLIRTKRKKYDEFSKDELDKIHEDFGQQVFFVQLKS